MNIFQRLFSKAQSSFSFVPQWVKTSFMPISFDRLYKDGYKINSAVSACVTALAFSFPEPPLLPGTETEGKFMPDWKHPALPLLRQPNLDMGEAEFYQFAVTCASIGGSVYFWKERAVNGRVLHLWPFSDAQISPVPGHSTSEGFVSRYDYNDGTGKLIPIEKEDIIQWKWMPDPKQPWRGIGAIELAARDVDKDNEATAYVYALLKNNAVPPIVITLTEGDELTAPKAKRLRKEWAQIYGGEGRGGPGFLEAGMKAEKLGFNMQELAAEALNAVPEARIAANFRVPPVVAGLSVGLKRSDYGDQAARRAFAEQTLTALWRSLASEITNGLKDDFGPSYAKTVYKFDMKQVLALRDDENKIWERANNAFDRGMLTRAQAKLIVGLEPEPGDNVYKLSLANEFVEASSKTSTTKGHKGNRKGSTRSAGRQLQRIRVDVARRMAQAVDVYFSQLADHVVERATGKSKSVGLPDAADLITADDMDKLGNLIKRFYLEILSLSWNAWNVSLGVELAFDLDDPLVAKILRMAEISVAGIRDYTLEELNRTLVYGSEHGWSIDDLVRGDPEAGVPGLRDIVDETYAGRARTIARTELGEAQNAASAQRYSDAGVELVEILDNGASDDDEPCQVADGQIWTLEYFSQNLLEHSNCTRCGAPYFGDEKPDRE